MCDFANQNRTNHYFKRGLLWLQDSAPLTTIVVGKYYLIKVDFMPGVPEASSVIN